MLKVLEDFYKKDIHEGDHVPVFEGSLHVINMNFTNEFGTFILCEFVGEGESHTMWTKNSGVLASPTNPFEILGSIHIPHYRNLLGGIGFFVKNHVFGEITGMTYEETWQLVFHDGARNAEASFSQHDHFHTRLIETIDGLPSLDSAYWKIPAYNEEGAPYADFTEDALFSIEKGMKFAVENRVREKSFKYRRKLTENTLSEVKEVSYLIKNANNIVILSGAGMSTISGIPDYRSSAESMWRNNPSVLEKLNQLTFEHEPETFWDAFYHLCEETLSPISPFPTQEALLATINAIKPNIGHFFFEWLQSDLHKDVTIIAQNVDGLDKIAGSQKVIEMHGNMHQCICLKCQMTYPLVQVLKKHHVPKCECGSNLRPNVVFFGDPVHQYDEAILAVQKADLLIVVGTSLQVAPFNELVYEKNETANAVLINGEEINTSVEFQHTAYGDIAKICRELKGLLME